VGLFKLHQIRSTDELRQTAVAWDDLWQRSDVASPVSRAEPVALRVEHLAGGSSFRGLIVEHEGRLVAALPLVNRRLKGILSVGSLPCNCWLAGGALLLDPQTDTAMALDCLLSAIPDLPWPVLWLDQVSFEDGTWRTFRLAAERAGLSMSVREHFRIGQIDIGRDWEAYKARMKGDHRRKVNRYVRKLDDAGGAELKVYRDMGAEQVEELTRRAFEIEDRSWKGAGRTSVLKNPTIFAHYCHEAQALAKFGLLEIAFLEHQGRPMAFVFAYSAKGVFYATKLGYDDEFAKFGPGQQLLWRLLEEFHADPTRRLFDFAGPLVPFHQVWATRSYPVGPLVVATPKLLGRGLFHAYTQWQPRARQVQEKVSTVLQGLRAAAAYVAATVTLRRSVTRPTSSPTHRSSVDSSSFSHQRRK
jgi:CelD/BcsL family acetyltransferase involved in cellulose biosynthesis